MIYDTIIVGGGMAGLYCAYKSRKINPTQKLLLLEGNDHLGGRAGNVQFHGESIPTGAGIGRKKKDVLLMELLKELHVPFHEFTVTSQYADTIRPSCRVKEMFLFLKREYNDSRDKSKTFQQYAKPKLNGEFGRNAYDNFVICAGYTDYENECCTDTLFHYGFDDNYSDWPGYGFSWNTLTASLAKEIGSQNIRLSSHVNKVTNISDDHYEIVTPNHRFLSKNVIIATTIESVKKLLPGKSMYNQIRGQHFLRMYGKFSHSSIEIMKEKCSKTTVVPGPIHKIIPMNADKGIYMIVYTDNKGATTLEKYKENTMRNRDILCRLLEIALDIPENKLELVDMVDFYWDVGTHYYSTIKGEYNNRREFIRDAQRPRRNMYVVGELISMKQGWVEGALESVEQVFEEI
jgi:hypothetical protein